RHSRGAWPDIASPIRSPTASSVVVQRVFTTERTETTELIDATPHPVQRCTIRSGLILTADQTGARRHDGRRGFLLGSQRCRIRGGSRTFGKVRAHGPRALAW